MNLAQLISPEWAQDGCRPRFDPRRPADALPPMGSIVRTAEQLTRAGAPVVPPARLPATGTLKSRVLQLLLKHKGSRLGSREIADGLGKHVDINHVCAVLPGLIADSYADRLGAEKNFRYAITPWGEQHLRGAGEG